MSGYPVLSGDRRTRCPACARMEGESHAPDCERGRGIVLPPDRPREQWDSDTCYTASTRDDAGRIVVRAPHDFGPPDRDGGQECRRCLMVRTPRRGAVLDASGHGGAEFPEARRGGAGVKWSLHVRSVPALPGIEFSVREWGDDRDDVLLDEAMAHRLYEWLGAWLERVRDG